VKIGICLPAFDQGSSWFAYDLAGMLAYTARAFPDIELRRFQCSGTWLPQVRHRLVTAALKADCEWLLFLDSDMRLPVQTLEHLLARCKSVIAANYTARQPPFCPTAVGLDGQRVYTDYQTSGLVEVLSAGMGVMLVHAALLRSIAPPWFMLTWSEKVQDYGGEDGYFCLKLREAGAKIWLDHDLSHDVTHMGVIELEQSHAVKMRHTLPVTEEDG